MFNISKVDGVCHMYVQKACQQIAYWHIYNRAHQVSKIKLHVHTLSCIQHDNTYMCDNVQLAIEVVSII